MRKFLICSLLLAVSMMALSACDTAGPSEANKPAVAKVTDDDIEKKIRAKYDADAAIKAADLDIDADADDNKVTLSGTVESQALRTRAVEMAKSAHANVIVTDKIDVKPREVSRAEYTEDMARTDRDRAKEAGDTVGSSLDDSWIHTKIATKLVADTRTPQNKINVDVNNNMVTLRGTVETAEQKAAAEQVARATEGVKGVKNMLKVGAAKP